MWLININMPAGIVDNLAEVIVYVTLELPITYLRILLDGNPRCNSFWDRVVSKAFRHLEHWEGGFFSLAGRVYLS